MEQYYDQISKKFNLDQTKIHNVTIYTNQNEENLIDILGFESNLIMTTKYKIIGIYDITHNMMQWSWGFEFTNKDKKFISASEHKKIIANLTDYDIIQYIRKKFAKIPKSNLKIIDHIIKFLIYDKQLHDVIYLAHRTDNKIIYYILSEILSQ